MAETPNNAADQAIAEKPSKSLWETVLTSTPVILTIVATFLAGQSAGEMTRAQYHRSLASQNQSKVADQWAFFQAKRIRGTSYEMTVELLGNLKDVSGFERGTLPASVEQLTVELRLAQKHGEKLRELARGGSNGATDALLSKKVDHLLATTKTTAEKAALLQKQASVLTTGSSVNRSLSPEMLEAVMSALNPSDEKTPSRKTAAVQSDDDKQIDEAVEAIQRRERDKTIAVLVLKISEDQLHDAIATAEEKAKATSDELRKIDQALREIDTLVEREVALGRDFRRAVRDLKAFLAENKTGPDATAMATILEAMERNADTIKSVTDEVSTDYKMARLAFTARRYEREARDNQRSADLYELQVYRSSANSDRHLLRSKNFFYGMLAAQVAVTIATLALAVRQKSLVWGLAAVAGVGAVLFSLYIMLDLA